jgi:hypothetical protein
MSRAPKHYCRNIFRFEAQIQHIPGILNGRNAPGVTVTKLFMSYARENRPDVDQLVEHLHELGYETWVDVVLRGGQDWWEEILRRIAETDVFIAIVSEAAINSMACRREFDWAEALHRPVLPVAIEPLTTNLPLRISKRQIIDYSDPAQRHMAALKVGAGLMNLLPAPPLPEQVPETPPAPLSYLTPLFDQVDNPKLIEREQQQQILNQLEPALESFDPEERRAGREILERFRRRPDLLASVYQSITRLETLAKEQSPVGTAVPGFRAAATQSADRSSREGQPLETSTAPTADESAHVSADELVASEAPPHVDTAKPVEPPSAPPVAPTPLEAAEPSRSGPDPSQQPLDIHGPTHQPQGIFQLTGGPSHISPESAISDTLPTASFASGATSAPGWYADPSGRPGFRYFDGNQWTDQFSSVSQQPPHQPRLRAGQKTGTNQLAIWSLISSLVGFACGIGSIVGIVLALVALNQISRTAQRGRGLAISGLLVGVASLIFFITIAILSSSSSHPQAANTGHPAACPVVELAQLPAG